MSESGLVRFGGEKRNLIVRAYGAREPITLNPPPPHLKKN